MGGFRYLAQATGRRSRQRDRPLGLLYGNRAFRVASSEWKEEPRLWRLANMSELRISDETFERDPDIDLERYAKRPFGTFKEEPVEVVLRFAPAAAADASNFVFHRSQYWPYCNPSGWTALYSCHAPPLEEVEPPERCAQTRRRRQIENANASWFHFVTVWLPVTIIVTN